MKPNEPTEAQKKAIEAELNKETSVSFKKRELIAIFNVIVSSTMKYGDFFIFKPIVDKIQPLVASASNIPESITKRAEQAEANHNGGIIGTKKELN